MIGWHYGRYTKFSSKVEVNNILLAIMFLTTTDFGLIRGPLLAVIVVKQENLFKHYHLAYFCFLPL